MSHDVLFTSCLFCSVLICACAGHVILYTLSEKYSLKTKTQDQLQVLHGGIFRVNLQV